MDCMKIGNVKLAGRMFLSPMAGVTDVAFRVLCREQGAALAYTEFVHASAIVHGNNATQKMIEVADEERPVGIQIFGSDIKHIVGAATAVEQKTDIIDFNLGCPAPNITESGCGAGLLKDLDKVEKVFKAL